MINQIRTIRAVFVVITGIFVILVMSGFFNDLPYVEVRLATEAEISQHHLSLMNPSDIMEERPDGWRITKNRHLHPPLGSGITIDIDTTPDGQIIVLPLFVNWNKDCLKFNGCEVGHGQMTVTPGTTLYIQVNQEAILYRVGDGFWGHSEVFVP